MTIALRIAQVSGSMSVKWGGAATAFMSTVAAVRTRDDLQLAAYATMDDPDDPSALDVREHPEEWTIASGVGAGFFPGDLARVVRADIGAGKIDVVHMHGLWSADMLAIARACIRAGVPYVWQVHGMLLHEAVAQKRWKKRLFLEMGLREALRSSAAILFVTQHERDHSEIPTEMERERLEVVPLAVVGPERGIDLAYRVESRARVGLDVNARVIAFMGRVHPVKRIEMTLGALSRVPDALLLVAGGGEGGYEKELRALAGRLDVAERVRFLGWTRGEEKWRALAGADVLALNSVHENFGYVAVEALLAGTRPVLTSNLALAEELREAGLGDVCAPDEESLARALGDALTRRAAADVLARGPAWVETHLSPGAVGARLAGLYHRVARKSAAHSA